ncbi:MAG TPA: hypothetical protein VF892_12305, partial [Pseudonocardiaceae bacterium]
AELARRWLPITLGEMTEADLRRVMTGPLARVGSVSFADGLVERILDDLRRTPNPLPLLEFTLAELWERRSGGWLTNAAYERLGGVSEALAGYAERVWSGLDPQTRTTAQRLLAQLARPVPGDELTVRRTALRGDCDDAQWALAQRLATTRLLTLHEVSAGRAGDRPVPGVELAHDSLLTHWNRLRELTERYRMFRLWQDGLRQRIETWSSSRSPKSRLLSGADLRDANRWAGSHGEHLGAAERAYIAASVRRRRRLRSRIAVAIVVVLVVAGVVYERRSGQVAEATAKVMAARAQELHSADSYGALELDLRAYRTDSSVGLTLAYAGTYGMVDKLLPDYRFAELPAAPQPATTTATKATTATTATTGPPANPGTSRSPFEIEGLAQTASADGRLLAATDPASQVSLWQVTGNRVEGGPIPDVFGPLDFSSAPVVSRSGRYVAFLQTVAPKIDPNNIHGPVDSNGLPAIDPSQYPTCVPKDVESVVPCLVVYDTTQHRISFFEDIPQVPSLTSGLFLQSIDPTDHVLGAVIPDDPTPLSAGWFQNTLYLYDLSNGRLLRKVRLPWRSVVGELWLGPGGRTAVVAEALGGGNDNSVDHESLSFVDLSGTSVVRQQIANGMTSTTDVAMSLDGRTVAAIVPVTGGGTQLVAWATATGTVTARVAGLTKEEGNGSLALDATGSRAWIAGRSDFIATRATNVEQILPAAMDQVLVLSLPSGARIGQFPLEQGWSAVWPLGSGLDAPLALVSGSTLGLVLPRPGAQPPARRLTSDASGDLSDARLCTLLGEPNQDKAAHDLAPSGAYQGPLCP